MAVLQIDLDDLLSYDSIIIAGRQHDPLSDGRCPHGFESCTEYRVRYYQFCGNFITWRAGTVIDATVVDFDSAEWFIKFCGMTGSLERIRSVCLTYHRRCVDMIFVIEQQLESVGMI
jgi:hypothetical protein